MLASDIFAVIIIVLIKGAGPTCTPPATISTCSQNPQDPSMGEIVPVATLSCGTSASADTSTAPAGGNGFVLCPPFDSMPTNKGLWFKFEEPTADFCSVTFSLCGGASFDTYFQVYQDEACTGGFPNCVNGNDDFCGAQSEITFDTASTTVYRIYYLYVSGLVDFAGPITLTATCN